MRTSKIVALVATTALLVVVSALTAFAANAATGGTWENTENGWKYKTKSGEYLTQGWAKSGTDNFYLDENGDMVVSQLVDDGENLYFVNETGAMVKNKWEKIANTNDDGDEYYWYYFKSSGAAQKDRSNKPVTIDSKKYMFDGDGHMLYGWINTSSAIEDDSEGTAWTQGTYYAGGQDDGEVRTNKWEKLAVVDNDNADSSDQEYWFYFQTSGEKVHSTDSDKYLEKSINGKKYAFDNNGAMKAEWAATTSISTASAIDNYAWYRLVTDTETGAKLKKGWFRTVPTASVSSVANAEEEKHWFYAKGNGTIAKSEVRTIDGKKYGFNDKGEMLSGLYKLKVTDGVIAEDTDWDKACIDSTTEVNDTKGENLIGKARTALDTYYFFGDEETDGSAKTGTVSTEIDGETYKITFGSTGENKYKALEKIKDNNYYVNGFKLVASADCKYQLFSIDPGNFVIFPDKDWKLTSLNDDTLKGGINPKYVPVSTAIQNAPYKPNYVLISSSGTIIKNATKITDADGNTFAVKYYVVTKINDTDMK